MESQYLSDESLSLTATPSDSTVTLAVDIDRSWTKTDGGYYRYEEPTETMVASAAGAATFSIPLKALPDAVLTSGEPETVIRVKHSVGGSAFIASGYTVTVTLAAETPEDDDDLPDPEISG